jgi:uncharacterized membrane protein
MTSTTYNRIAGQELARISALSDGLFSIAMTLLVFDIRVPAIAAVHSEQDLIAAVMALGPRFLMYLMSFLTLGIFWVGHQTQIGFFARADRNLAWIHILFLATIAIMPFSTSLLAQFITFRTALLFYWANVLLIGIVMYASWAYACRAGLMKTEATQEVRNAMTRRIFIGQSLYALGAALCVFNTYWSIGFIVLVQLNYAIAPKVGFLERL